MFDTGTIGVKYMFSFLCVLEVPKFNSLGRDIILGITLY